MMKSIFAAACAALLLSVPPALAGDDASGTWDPLQPVIAHPSIVSPPMWHVKKGDSDIWLIGMPAMIPKHFVWNDSEIAGHIAGAKALYTPAQPDLGMSSLKWFMRMHDVSLPDGQRLNDYLSLKDQARLKREMAQVDVSPDDYEEDRPQRALFRLWYEREDKNAYWRPKTGLKLQEKLSDIADDKDVDVKSIGSYAFMPAMRAFFDLSTRKAASCLVAGLDDIEAWRKNLEGLANGWAAGDIPALKAHFSPDHVDLCLRENVPAYARAVGHREAMEKQAVDRALNAPGKRVFLLPLSFLVSGHGMLWHLKQQGLSIEQISSAYSLQP